MSKLLSRTVLATALMGLACTTQSQALPVSFQPLKSPLYAQVSAPKSPVATAPDLTLLSKAVGAFWQTDRTETDSQVTISMIDKGLDMKVYARVKTIAQIGDRFNAQLEFAPPGSKDKITYTIVSDGQKVWTYRPDLRQYSETSLSKFKTGSNSFWIGVSSFFFLSLTETQRQEMVSSLGTDRDFIKAMPQAEVKDIEGMNREVNGEKFYVFSYKSDVEKLKFVFFLDPTSATTKRLEFSGNDRGLNVTFDEKIITRNTQVKFDKQTFTFSPPKGTKKVKTLAIEPFGS
jgi:outer membrane lipoprotein-sorting protein